MISRKEFFALCALLGVDASLGALPTRAASAKTPGKVVVIGAGAAGLSAAYLLNQRGVEVTVLEAASQHGGRMKRTLDFADFPIPLGAEWLHVSRDIFTEIINNPAVAPTINTTPYNQTNDYGLYQGARISPKAVGFTVDQKFINATWFDFYESYIAPAVTPFIKYQQVVSAIDYRDKKIKISTGEHTYFTDHAVVTVPVKLLQNDAIQFVPPLPTAKQQAISKVQVWPGCKAFVEFSEKFYPAFVPFNTQPETAGQKLYYDAAYGQTTRMNVLGLFAVGTPSVPYTTANEHDRLALMLAELDAIFAGKASASYKKHIFQNWNTEPFAQGAYVSDYEFWRRIRTLGQPVDNRLFFAGDAYTNGEDWASVHAAAQSAKAAVQHLFAGGGPRDWWLHALSRMALS